MQATRLIANAPPESSYHISKHGDGRTSTDFIMHRLIQSFMNANRIVLMSQTWKLMVCTEKHNGIERAVALHLGYIKRSFDSGSIDESCIQKSDETYFVLKLESGKTLSFVGDQQVKYLYVVSGGESMTMMVEISGGPNATIHPPMIVFKNSSHSYPIRGVPHNVPGVFCRSPPNPWMDVLVFRQWF